MERDSSDHLDHLDRLDPPSRCRRPWMVGTGLRSESCEAVPATPRRRWPGCLHEEAGMNTTTALRPLESLLDEPLRLRHHTSGVWRVDPTDEPARSPNAGFWLARGRGGWFHSAEEALIHLAHAFGCHAEPPHGLPAIEQAVLDLVGEAPGHYTARHLRRLANRQTGRIPCAGARCDAAIRRLVEQGRLIHTRGDGRCAGRLQLAQ